MDDLPTLIQQALDAGDTATARSLSRAYEQQTKFYTIQYVEPIYEVDVTPSQSNSYNYVDYSRQIFQIPRISHLLIIFLIYASVAQMATPGTTKYNWLWGWDFTIGRFVGEK